VRRWILIPLTVGVVVTLAAGAAASAPPRVPTASTRALLAAGLITANDVPAAWTGSRQTNDLKVFAGVPTCHALYLANVAANRRVPNVLSRQFTDPASNGTTLASDQVFAFRTVAAASAFLAVLQRPNTASCLTTVIQKVLASSGVTDTTAAASPITTLGALGDGRAGYEVTLAATIRGGSISLVADFVVVRVGRVVVLPEFLNENRSLPEGPQIVTTVVNRVEAVG